MEVILHEEDYCSELYGIDSEDELSFEILENKLNQFCL
jgi:hypothetical protein